ncbi:jg9092 [Pararge aegeria aegeria]|uniref:Jg9092 protein n=1 Tax=Pararge aegeria aegeria TaxID=348720 RepID=A0A8S4S226_9NEOP|nr:jg9092 [Pararge aegeria aegeria]
MFSSPSKINSYSSIVHVVDNAHGVNVVDNSGGNPFPNNPDGFVIDEAFYQPSKPNYGSNNGDNYPPKKYDNPMLRDDKQ